MSQVFLLLQLIAIAAVAAPARFEVLDFGAASAFFGGNKQSISVLIRNSGPAAGSALSMRLYQLSSSIAAPLTGIRSWKRLSIGSNQTVVERVEVDFPSVRAVTKCELRWLDDAQRFIGRTTVTLFPTNLLKQLTGGANSSLPGVYDPGEEIIPLLRALDVEFVNLNENERLQTFHNSLAILGPFTASEAPVTPSRMQVAALRARGVNVILVSQPSMVEEPDLARLDYMSRPIVLNQGGQGRLVLLPAEAISGVATNPLPQLALLQCARLATSAQPFIHDEP